ncbi:MAG: FAD-dependent oxidoreductase [Armatimonadetes bacterium]|nr:FAD-dependent oxidoreductase [Armatimonadota bacterium]
MADRGTHAPFRYRSLDELRAAIEQLGLDMAVDEDTSILARPVQVAGRTIPNSMAVQPMEGCDGKADGSPDELTVRRYRRFGAGGAGLLWFEATAVVPEGRANPRQLWIRSETKDSFARLLEDSRKAAAESMGANHRPFAVLQLTHSGRYSKPGKSPSPIIAQHDPLLDPTRGTHPDQPVITDDELDALQDRYVEAARLAFEAGFDAVDVKACHRYLINELLASHTRDGRYGGSYENRTRFLKTVIGRVFDECGRDKIVTTRLGIHDAHPYPYGWGMDPDEPMKPNLDEPKRLIRELYDMGVRLVDITMGNPYFNPHVNRPYDTPIIGFDRPGENPLAGEERLISLTREVREGAPEMVVIGSGYSWLRNLWPHVAAAEIGRGSVQIVGLGRQAFAFPGFAKEIIETGKLDIRHTCITCSSCTQIMRDGGTAGCVPFDKEVYGPIYREGRRNSPDYILAQASRCRDCFDPQCRDGCPAGVDIPGFIHALADGDIRRSYEILRERNALPETCGCVCPAEVQCEGHCVESTFSQNPVPVRELQAYVTRVAREKGWASLPTEAGPTGRRIAVIGAGPAGLACASELLKRGHSVEVFDIRETIGGTAEASIPSKRLAADLLESEGRAVLGDRMTLHAGRGLTAERNLDSFVKEYDAVFLGMGLGKSPTLLEAEAPLLDKEGLGEVHDAQTPSAQRPVPLVKGNSYVRDAVAFLWECKNGEAVVPERVAVLGGGNTAIDAATQAIEGGARDVYLVYRRSFAEMPAWPAERDEALNLGVHFLMLTQPLGYEFEGDRLKGVRIARTVLGEPDASGRRRPAVVPDSESLLEVDLVLEALGQSVPEEIARLIPGVELARGKIKVDESGRTSRAKVYAGGDIVNGGATVVQAVAEGMRAARAITDQLG